MAVPHALHGSALAVPTLGAPAAASLARSVALDPAMAAGAKPATDLKTRAHTAAVNFEAQFLNSMFSQMLAGVQGDGPFGGGPAVGVWRSFLCEQYAKSFAKAGGIGIADKVYHTLLAQQEAHAH
ncbi:MAG TPA: flagellar assembly peptidoglycan hydrolase FlgJ [Xanthobacteraceae bacterium]|jgi:Rod binding domain-containing protein